MIVEKIERDATVIEFYDDYIVEDLTETRKIDLELFIFKAMEQLSMNCNSSKTAV